MAASSDPKARRMSMLKRLEMDAAALREKVEALPPSSLKLAMQHMVNPEARADGAHSTAVSKARRDSIDRLGSPKKRPLPDHEVTPEDVGIETELHMPGGEMGNAAAIALGEMLFSPAMRHLHVLDLSSNKLTDIGSEFTGIGTLASALAKNNVMVSLNLARNQLQVQGALAVARMLGSNTSIEFVDLSRNALRSEGASAIANAISFDNNPGSALVSLNLAQNNLTNFEEAATGGMALAAAIGSHQRLTYLDLSHNRLDPGAVGAIAYALKRNQSMIDIRLDYNNANPEAVEMLAASLMENRTLTNLGLSNNRILSDGAKTIAGILAANPALASVDISDNHISGEGRLAVAAVMRPDDKGVQEELAKSTSVTLPEVMGAHTATAAKVAAALEAAAAADAPAADAPAAEAEAAEGKGAEADGDADDAEEGDGKAKEYPGAKYLPLPAGSTGPVDLTAAELTFVSPTSGQVVKM